MDGTFFLIVVNIYNLKLAILSIFLLAHFPAVNYFIILYMVVYSLFVYSLFVSKTIHPLKWELGKHETISLFPLNFSKS